MAKKKIKNTGFTVMQAASDYNDEVNFLSEGGSPVRVYRNKEKAEQEARESNKAKFIGGVGNYGYNYDVKDWANKCFESGIKVLIDGKEVTTSFDDDDKSYPDSFAVHKDVTDKQIEEVIEITGLRFYSVEEVELELD